jgi:hypothetical protein
MHGTRSTQTRAAAVLGPFQADPLANNPQQWLVAIAVMLDGAAINFESNHRFPPLQECFFVRPGYLTSSPPQGSQKLIV